MLPLVMVATEVIGVIVESTAALRITLKASAAVGSLFRLWDIAVMGKIVASSINDVLRFPHHDTNITIADEATQLAKRWTDGSTEITSKEVPELVDHAINIITHKSIDMIQSQESRLLPHLERLQPHERTKTATATVVAALSVLNKLNREDLLPWTGKTKAVGVTLLKLAEMAFDIEPTKNGEIETATARINNTMTSIDSLTSRDEQRLQRDYSDKASIVAIRRLSLVKKAKDLFDDLMPGEWSSSSDIPHFLNSDPSERTRRKIQLKQRRARYTSFVSLIAQAPSLFQQKLAWEAQYPCKPGGTEPDYSGPRTYAPRIVSTAAELVSPEKEIYAGSTDNPDDPGSDARKIAALTKTVFAPKTIAETDSSLVASLTAATTTVKKVSELAESLNKLRSLVD